MPFQDASGVGETGAAGRRASAHQQDDGQFLEDFRVLAIEGQGRLAMMEGGIQVVARPGDQCPQEFRLLAPGVIGCRKPSQRLVRLLEARDADQQGDRQRDQFSVARPANQRRAGQIHGRLKFSARPQQPYPESRPAARIGRCLAGPRQQVIGFIEPAQPQIFGQHGLVTRGLLRLATLPLGKTAQCLLRVVPVLRQQSAQMPEPGRLPRMLITQQPLCLRLPAQSPQFGRDVQRQLVMLGLQDPGGLKTA